MHIVTLSKGFDLGAVLLQTGSYYVEDVTAGELLARSGEKPVEALWARNNKPFNPPTCKKLLVVRSGGYGDLLFLTPIFAALKLQVPGIHIAVACWSHFGAVLENNEDVDELVNYPVMEQDWNRFDQVVWLENAVEFNPKAKKEHITRVFQSYFHGPTVEHLDCLYYPTPQEMQWAHEHFPQSVKPRLGVQVFASSPARSYNFRLTGEVITAILREGWEVFLFGAPGEVEAFDIPGIVNLSAKKLTFRQSAAVLALCDVALAPDSALCHLAQALGVPTVALYASFPARLRIPKDANVEILEPSGKCAPCFHHSRPWATFPKHQQCAALNRCTVLDSIPPRKVVKAIFRQYRRRKM